MHKLKGEDFSVLLCISYPERLEIGTCDPMFRQLHQIGIMQRADKMIVVSESGLHFID